MTRMFDAISPSELSAAPGGVDKRATAAVELGFARREGRTRLTRLYQRTPLRALFPRHEVGDLPVAALVNVGGGLVCRRHGLDFGRGRSGRGRVGHQPGRREGLPLHRRGLPRDDPVEGGRGGWLEWCPQETILFDRARLRRKLRLDLVGSARAMLGEILVFGRHARASEPKEAFCWIGSRSTATASSPGSMHSGSRVSMPTHWRLARASAARAVPPPSSMRQPTPRACSTVRATGCQQQACEPAPRL